MDLFKGSDHQEPEKSPQPSNLSQSEGVTHLLNPITGYSSGLLKSFDFLLGITEFSSHSVLSVLKDSCEIFLILIFCLLRFEGCGVTAEKEGSGSRGYLKKVVSDTLLLAPPPPSTDHKDCCHL